MVGSKLILNGRPFQVIGVAPASFYGLEVGQNFDAALPLCSEPVFSTNLSRPSLMDSPAVWWLAAIGRSSAVSTTNRSSKSYAWVFDPPMEMKIVSSREPLRLDWRGTAKTVPTLD